jgi:hypothetical protein
MSEASRKFGKKFNYKPTCNMGECRLSMVSHGHVSGNENMEKSNMLT